jgi:hypothetical protein
MIMLADMHQVNIHSIELKHKAYVAISSDIYLGTTKGNKTHFTLLYHIKIYEAGPHFHLTSVSSSFISAHGCHFIVPCCHQLQLKLFTQNMQIMLHIE